MKKFLLVAFALTLIANISFAQDQHAYAGLKKCKMCHKGEKNGEIFEKWESTQHAKAFETLASDTAKKIYAKLGKEGSPQEDAACLKCHVTGHGVAAELGANLVAEEGVTCEACHGAGGDFWKKPIMTDRETALANGLVAEPKKGCVKCHNEESPTYKEFKVEVHFPKIEHRLPKE